MPESVITADSFGDAVDRDRVIGVGVASSVMETMLLSPSLGSLGSFKDPNVSGQELRSQGSTEQHPLKLFATQE
jgi:hypothetical protein